MKFNVRYGSESTSNFTRCLIYVEVVMDVHCQFIVECRGHSMTSNGRQYPKAQVHNGASEHDYTIPLMPYL